MENEFRLEKEKLLAERLKHRQAIKATLEGTMVSAGQSGKKILLGLGVAVVAYKLVSLFANRKGSPPTYHPQQQRTVMTDNGQQQVVYVQKEESTGLARMLKESLVTLITSVVRHEVSDLAEKLKSKIRDNIRESLDKQDDKRKDPKN